MNLRIISKTDLSARTQDVVHQVRQGQPAIVHSSGGEDQVVLLDALDYRLLHGVAGWATRPAAPAETSTEEQVIRAYLDEEVSLGRAAELLGISRFDLQARFQRLDIPLRQGPATETEALEEIEVAQELAARAS